MLGADRGAAWCDTRGPARGRRRQSDHGRCPLFGCDGPVDLGNPAGFEIWDTLIPDSGTLFNVAGDGYSLTNVTLEDGDAAYLGPSQSGPSTVPEPASLGLMLAGLLGLGIVRRRRR